MTRRVDPAFQELLTASLLFFLPAHKDGRLSDAQARARLAKALDLPRGQFVAWPIGAVQLAVRAQMALDGDRRLLDRDVLAEAHDAKWPRFVPGARYAWQDRRDIGDCEAAA